MTGGLYAEGKSSEWFYFGEGSPIASHAIKLTFKYYKVNEKGIYTRLRRLRADTRDGGGRTDT